MLNANGSATYTPAAGYSGSDSFTYKANDGLALSAPMTVSITVVPKPATTLTVTSAPTTIDHGSSYAFTGVLKLGALGLPGQTITLEQSTDGTTSRRARSRVAPESAAPSRSARADQQDVVPGDVRRDGLLPRLNERGGDGLGSPLCPNPIAPKTMKTTKSYTVYGALKPATRGRHEAGADLQVQEGRQDVEGSGYVKAVAYDYKGYTRYKVSMRLTTKGSWRLRAYAPADAGHSRCGRASSTT